MKVSFALTERKEHDRCAWVCRLLLVKRPVLSAAGAHLSFCALANTSSLTPCFSLGLGDVLARQPFQRLSAHGKPLKAAARIRPPSPTLLKQGVNESAADNAHQTS